MVEPVPFAAQLLPSDESVDGAVFGAGGREADAAQLLVLDEAARIALRRSFEQGPPPVAASLA